MKKKKKKLTFYMLDSMKRQYLNHTFLFKKSFAS